MGRFLECEEVHVSSNGRLFNIFLPSPLQIATAGFVTEEKAQEVEQFFKDNPCAMAERVVKQNCEAIRVNAKWLQRDTQAVKEWLSTQ